MQPQAEEGVSVLRFPRGLENTVADLIDIEALFPVAITACSAAVPSTPSTKVGSTRVMHAHAVKVV